MIGPGNILKNSISPFGALITLDIENSKVFEEIMFSIAKRLAIPSSAVGGGVVDIVIDPTACTCDFVVFLPAVFKAFGAGPVNIDMYFGTDSDEDGTLLESGNRDNTSSNTADLVTRMNPTINNDGMLLPFEFVILSNGTAAIATAGGESKEGQVFNARKDGKYMFRLINQEANPAFGHISFNWFEVNI